MPPFSANPRTNTTHCDQVVGITDAGEDGCGRERDPEHGKAPHTIVAPLPCKRAREPLWDDNHAAAPMNGPTKNPPAAAVQGTRLEWPARRSSHHRNEGVDYSPAGLEALVAALVLANALAERAA